MPAIECHSKLSPLLLLGLVTLTWGCAPPAEQVAAPEAEQSEPVSVEAPSLDELANTTFSGIAEEPVQLVDGRWEGEPYAEGGASRPSVGLVDDFLLVGDLTGDGQPESVALLWTSSGGSGTFDYVVAAGRDGRDVSILGTAELGDRVQVRGGQIVDGQIVLDVVQAGPDDAACCPSQLAKRIWELRAGDLIEGEAEITGTLSLAVLEGTEWRLTDFDRNEPAPDEPEVTLAFEGGRIAGSSGCNRYFADVEEGGDMPGSISIGSAGSTQMMCPEPVMEIEGRFLKRLAGVKQYSFMAGKLVITWQDGDHYGSMMFIPREP